MPLHDNYAKNLILYGPPGTGKTFHSVSYAVAIATGQDPEAFIESNKGPGRRESVKKEFDELRESGQIQFCTFHQSLGYEDFIEGIKPLPPDEEDDEASQPLSYVTQDGIFKRLCTEAAYEFVPAAAATSAPVLAFSEAYDALVTRARDAIDAGNQLTLTTRSGANIAIEDVSRHNNLRVRHANGKKTYGVSKARLSRIAHAFPDLAAINNIHDEFRAEIGGSNATAYFAVLKELRENQLPVAQVGHTSNNLTYADKKEAIRHLTHGDYNASTDKRFVLIVDEINRGNVSSIFGELITLLEDDKRLGKDEALTAQLPYSGEDEPAFGVPPNLYIIGTMNTADRSVEALDTALRRRFSFVHKGPEYDGLSTDCEGVNLKELLRKLNRRLTILLDADHTIGHAWLWNVQTLDELRAKFKNKILPLLQEYFYNDYEKLGLVLGDAFFQDVTTVSDNELAAFSKAGNEASDYTDKVILELKDTAHLQAADFKSIYSNVTANVAS